MAVSLRSILSGVSIFLYCAIADSRVRALRCPGCCVSRTSVVESKDVVSFGSTSLMQLTVTLSRAPT